MHLISKSLQAICAALLMATGASAADDPPPCTAPAYRAFDFWLGEWAVTANGKTVGSNTIRSILRGCALHESWRSASGGLGESLTMYDAVSHRWHQLWTDTDGDMLSLSGSGTSSGMELEGVRTDAATAKRTRERIRWTPHADGSVTQRWDFAPEGTSDWAPRFEGRYARKTASESGAEPAERRTRHSDVRDKPVLAPISLRSSAADARN